jgi:hypothetical protein
MRQHASAYVSVRQHTSAYVSIRQRTSAYATCSSAGEHGREEEVVPRRHERHVILHTSPYVSVRQHTSAHVSTRQHTSAHVSIRYSIRGSSSAEITYCSGLVGAMKSEV